MYVVIIIVIIITIIVALTFANTNKYTNLYALIVSELPEDNTDASLMRAVLTVHAENYNSACMYIDDARSQLAGMHVCMYACMYVCMYVYMLSKFFISCIYASMYTLSCPKIRQLSSYTVRELLASVCVVN